jgi:enoyl-CoA hydratase/carnithine racemase
VEYSTLKVSRESPLEVITIDRPPVNALNGQAIEDLGHALGEALREPSVKAVIITGAGQYCFVAGADLGQFLEMGPEEGQQLIQKGKEVFDTIETMPKPVVAAINGVCLGGGLEMAMACDVRVAAEGSRMGQPEINLGIIPGWGGTQRLSRLVGKTRAMEMLLTGDMIKAAEALRFGLVNKVVPDNELMAHAKNLARKLAMQAPRALAAIKAVLWDGLGASLPEGLRLETEAFVKVFQSRDAREGINAFLEKRKPQFTGE